MVAKLQPAQRKTLYKLREAEKKKAIKEEYNRPTELKKKLLKNLSKMLPSKLTNRAILRKEPRATVVLSGEPAHNKYFKAEYEKARWT